MGLVSGLVGAAANGADRLAAAFVAVQPGDYDPSSGHGPEWGKAAPAGLLIWLFMGTALFFLIKSMNRHIKRVPKTFDADAAASAESSDVEDVAGAEASGHEETDMTLSSAGAESASEKAE